MIILAYFLSFRENRYACDVTVGLLSVSPKFGQVTGSGETSVELEMDGIEKQDLFIVLGIIFVIYKYLLETQTGMNHCYLDRIARLKSYFKRKVPCNMHV
jgi:hypothetical protein